MKKISKQHDKTFKHLFSNKIEVAKFVNKILIKNGLKEQIKSYDLEKCNTEFITKEIAKLESDILYKIKNKRIYILIEHQSTVDYSMPMRILEYCIEIMREVKKQEDIDFSTKDVPVIYPIVLYTGRKKWNAKEEISLLQPKLNGIKSPLFSKYTLVDINDYSKEELLKEKGTIAKAMLIEKAKSEEELIETMEIILKQGLIEEEKNFMLDIMSKILQGRIGVEKTKEIIEKINKKNKGGNDMVVEKVERFLEIHYDRGVTEGKRKGKREGKIEVAKKMLKRGMKIEDIQEITELTESSISKLKKEMNNIN